MGETNIVQLPFTGGLDQKTAVEYLDGTTRQAAVMNANFDKNGALDKRLGMALLGKTTGNAPSLTTPTSSGTINATYRLANWSRSPLTAFCDSGVYDYDQGTAQFQPVGTLQPVRAVRRPIPINDNLTVAGTPLLCDFVLLQRNLRLCLYNGTASTTPFYTVYDADTFEVYSSAAAVPPFASTARTCVAAFDAGLGAPNRILVFYINSSSLFASGYNPTTNTWTAAVTLTTLATGFDLAPNGAQGVLLSQATAAGAVSVATISNALVLSGATTVATGQGSAGYPAVSAAVDAVNNNAWIAWNYNSSTVYTVLNATTLATRFAPVTVGSTSLTGNARVHGIVVTSSTTAAIVYRQALYTASGQPFACYLPAAGFVTSSGTVTNTIGLPCGVEPIAKPFLLNGLAVYAGVSAFAIGSSATDVDVSLLLVQLPSPSPAYPQIPQLLAISAPRQLLTSTIPPYIRAASTLSSQRFAVPIETLGIDDSSTAGADSVTQDWSVDFVQDTALSFGTTDVLGELHIAAGAPCTSDGGSLHETSFVTYPEFAFATASGTATINTAYAVVYVSQDGAGNLSRSAPYQLPPVVSATSVTLTIPICPISMRVSPTYTTASQTKILIEIYKSVAGGSTLYYVTSIPGTPSFTYGASPVTTYVDGTPSTVDSTASILYTTGGVLDSVIPPSGPCIVSHKNRIWRSDDTQQAIWFSKQASPGDEPAFNEALFFPCSEGGDITGLASLDDKLVIFKANTILIVYGDGPANTGQGSDLTIPQRIASDVGCVDWRSLVVAPPGVFFRAAQGIYLLDRGLNVTYIGKNVEDALNTNVVASAQLVSNNQQVRFVLQTGNTSLVYDYQSQAWSVHSYAQLSGQITSATVNGLTLALSTSDGYVWQENVNAFGISNYYDQDNTGASHFVPMSVTSAWVRLSGMQSYLRARRILFMGHALDKCALSMGIAVNYDPTVVQTATFTNGFLSAQSAVPQCVTHVAGAYNKSQSIQVTVTDAADSGTSGRGCRFLGLAFELDNIGQINRRVPIQARQ